MPKWLLPNEDGYISFMASKDLYQKFLGVAFCIVFRVQERKKEKSFSLLKNAFVNGREVMTCCQGVNPYVDMDPLNSDYVWLQYAKPKSVWRVDDFGPNDLSHFHFSIRVIPNSDGRVIVKKCGFRIICKPLENDLEVLFQDDQLLDPTLLYEIGYEDSQTSLKEERPSETEDLQDSQRSTEEDSSSKLLHKGSNIVVFSMEKFDYSNISPHYRNVRPGGEMPKEFVLVEEDTISFMVSKDLYNKFIGLALCVVFGVEDGKKEISFDIVPHVHGRRRNVLSGTLGSFDSDHTWIQYLEPNLLWGVLQGAVDFDQFEESYLRFSLTVRVLSGTMKKLGYMLRFWQLQDDLKLVLKENQLVDPASLL